ncbi:MAG TPA: Lpg1974 family pore-forming outer membrane protein, partial [Caulobacteraceae bacterium]
GQSIYCLACGGSRPVADALLGINAAHPKTFDPEFVNAYEIGAKNTLFDARVTLNLAAFYYDYTGYQISQIVDRSAANLNFDADVWGIELEGDWRPVQNFRMGLKIGYENTRVADGESAIDLMDRANGGRPDDNGISWVVVSPFPTFPSNCILPAYLFVATAGGLNGGGGSEPHLVNLGGPGGGNPSGCELAYALGLDPITALPYVANPTESASLGSLGAHPGYAGFNPATAPNGGAGFSKDLSGNELPNAPHYTATITADYTAPLAGDWLLTLHTDVYYQSEAWTRIFNTEGYDKLKAYTNVNLAAILASEERGWKVMAYVKNVFDRDSITGAFLNSDDTGLTTNVFLTEPRIYGLRVTKDFRGGAWWTGANPNHPAGEPYPLTVEIGGQVQRHDAPYAKLKPGWYADEDGQTLFSSATDPLTPQNRDLDWGDGRDVKVTWRPEGSPWFVSGGIRYAKTNGSTPNIHQDEIAGPKVCAVPSDYQGGLFAKLLCDPTFDYYGYLPPGYYYNEAAVVSPRNWSDSKARGKEDHLFVDFQAGRDVGMGLIGAGRSQLSAGLRYAHLQSTTVTTMGGITNFDLPDGFAAKYANLDDVSAFFDAERDFKGTGPTLTWDAAVPLWENGDMGRVDLDWSLTGGVLFGKQRTDISGEEKFYHFYGKYYGAHVGSFLDPVTPTPIDIHRSKSATVPLLDLGLGLSYEVQRIKVSTGYRWERYFDAVDGGFAEHQSDDRTIDGPYFKLSVGFGG